MDKYLTVCGTTGKRKACKDCSCGLAEELAGETSSENVPVQKSSCGSVSYDSYLVRAKDFNSSVLLSLPTSVILAMLSGVLRVPISECRPLNLERKFS